MVIKFMRGIFQLKPSLPRYSSTWDIKALFDVWAPTDFTSLSLKALSMRLATLLALLTGQRLQTLTALKTTKMVLKDDNVEFYIDELLKTSTESAHMSSISLNRYDSCPNLCIVKHLSHYVSRTSSLRIDDRLLISFNKPYKGVSKDTLSRWIKSTLCEAGIDVAVFSAHSTRAASSSAAMKALQGRPIDAILRAGNWASAKTFARYYNKPINSDLNFCDLILDSSVSNLNN